MYVSVLSGRVPREDWDQLQHSFNRICSHPPEGLLEIELVQCVEDPSHWEVFTTWKSQEAFEEAQQQGRTAHCEQMFCEAGSVPQRTQFRMITRYERV